MFQNYLTNYIGLRPILVGYHSPPVHCYIIFCIYIYVLIKRGKNASVRNGTWRDLVLGQYEYEASFEGGIKSKTPLS